MFFSRIILLYFQLVTSFDLLSDFCMTVEEVCLAFVRMFEILNISLKILNCISI